MGTLAGWGRHPVVKGEERCSEALAELEAQPLLRGLGRSYGDASLPAPQHATVGGSRWADRLLAFDAETGVLRAEAGASLVDLDRIFPSRGFTVPVVPGTQHVTLGGMVASDVHGKNHHVSGCIGAHVRALRIRVADGRTLEVTPEMEPELFAATLGGLGLTGHVLEVELQLAPVPSPWIRGGHERAANLGELLAALRRASAQWPYTVAWCDALASGRSAGRGVVTFGRWATEEEAPPTPPVWRRGWSLPFGLPSGLVGGWSWRPANAVRFWMHRREQAPRILHPQRFFYPLDGLRDWNRAYGVRGFTQAQCVLPADDAEASVLRVFATLRARRAAPLITVIKDCGAEGRGTISFPRPGVTIAMDFAMQGDRTQRIVDALNEVVIECGGRVYLAKDALTRPEHFRAMEPRLPAFLEVRRKWDPELRLRSALSVRLFGDPA